MKFKDTIKVGSNVRLRLRDVEDGKIIEERESHNIFVAYGREWISELTAYQALVTPFRGDRVRYMAVGIGGYQQTMAQVAIQTLGYAGFPNDWQYTAFVPPLTTGGEGGVGTPATPSSQLDTDPTVTGLEYPVQITAANYYDPVKWPATFPEAGTVRFTAVLGYNDVSYGAYTTVPLSEIGLFTSSITEGVTNTQMPPLDAAEFRGDYPPASGNFFPPVGTRFMIAYNTFPTLNKTSSFVLQVDWELRFA